MPSSRTRGSQLAQTPSTNTLPCFKMHSCSRVDSLCYPAKVVGSSCTHHPFLLRLPVVPVRTNHHGPVEQHTPTPTTQNRRHPQPTNPSRTRPHNRNSQSGRPRPVLPQAHHLEARRHQPADGQRPAATPRRTAAERQSLLSTDLRHITMPVRVCQQRYYH